jgi:hypothetical protein
VGRLPRLIVGIEPETGTCRAQGGHRGTIPLGTLCVDRRAPEGYGRRLRPPHCGTRPEHGTPPQLEGSGIAVLLSTASACLFRRHLRPSLESPHLNRLPELRMKAPLRATGRTA